MSGFDDLQYFGLRVTTSPRWCSQCQKETPFYEEKKECSVCGLQGDPNEEQKSALPFELSSLPIQMVRLFDSLGISPSEAPIVEEMMNSLSNGGSLPFAFPTVPFPSAPHGVSDAFLSSPSLTPHPLRYADFLRPLLTVSCCREEFSVIPAEFGLPILERHTDGEGEVTHMEGPLIHPTDEYAESDFEKGTLHNSIAIIRRGRVTFAMKSLRVQSSEGFAVVVIQEGNKWPFVMTDSKKEGGALRIPIVGISSRDGETIIKRMNGVVGGDTSMRMFTRKIDLSCPICSEEMKVGDPCIQLQCRHLFCPNCILTWLKKRNTCALCRFEVDADEKEKEAKKKTISEEKQREDNKALLHSQMFA